MKKFTLIDRLRIPTYDNVKHVKTADLFLTGPNANSAASASRSVPVAAW